MNLTFSADALIADIEGRAQLWRDQELASIAHNEVDRANTCAGKALVLENLADDYKTSKTHYARYFAQQEQIDGTQRPEGREQGQRLRGRRRIA